MRRIATLFSGGDRDTLSGLFQPTDSPGCGGPDTRPGQWCQTQPGQRALSRLEAALSARTRRRGRGAR